VPPDSHFHSRFKDCTFSVSKSWDHTLRALPPPGFHPSLHWHPLREQTKNIDDLLPASGAAISPVNFAVHLSRTVRLLTLRIPQKRRIMGGWTRSLYIPPSRKVNSHTLADLLLTEVPEQGSLLEFYYLDRTYAISKMQEKTSTSSLNCRPHQILMLTKCLWASIPFWKPISKFPRANIAADKMLPTHDGSWDRNIYVSLFRPQPYGGGVHLWILSKPPPDLDDQQPGQEVQWELPQYEFCNILKDVELDGEVLNKSLPQAAALIDDEDIARHPYGDSRCKGLLTMWKGAANIASLAPKGLGQLYAAISPLPLGSFANDVSQYKGITQWDRLETGTGLLADSNDFANDWPHGGSSNIGSGSAWIWRPIPAGNTYTLRTLMFLSGLQGAHIGIVANQISIYESV